MLLRCLECEPHSCERVGIRNPKSEIHFKKKKKKGEILFLKIDYTYILIISIIETQFQFDFNMDLPPAYHAGPASDGVVNEVIDLSEKIRGGGTS